MRPLAAALAFVFVSVVAAAWLSMAAGGLHVWAAWTALAAGVACAAAAWRSVPAAPVRRPGAWDWLVIVVYALVCLRAFLWVLSTSADEVRILSPYNLGDMSLHLNFIRYLASGVPFWPDSSILGGTPLSYPIGTDFFNSLFEILGTDTIRGIVWVGLLGAALTGLALWFWGGSFAIAAILFNGGLAGFAIFQTGQLADFQQELAWKNVFLAMFVTQRGLLFAVPAGLALLSAWRNEFLRREPRLLPRWLQVTLYAGMPLFSVHTFLFLSAVLVGVFVTALVRRDPNQVKQLLALGTTSFLPATMIVFLVTGAFAASSGLHFAPGWIVTESHMPDMLATAAPALRGLAIWVWNFGLALPLTVVLAVLLAFRGGGAEARCFVWSSIGLFAVASVVSFTQWSWDNMKLLLWCWLVIAPYLWSKILSPLAMPARVAVCVVLFFSGAVSLAGGLDARHGYQLARRSELDAWRAALADIPPTDRIACTPDYNHPVILLGRPVACGYEGHLWSHGLDYQKRLAVLRNCLAGKIPWEAGAPLLGAKWAAVRQTDPPGAFPTPSGTGTLYDLRVKRGSASPEDRLPPQRSVDLLW